MIGLFNLMGSETLIFRFIVVLNYTIVETNSKLDNSNQNTSLLFVLRPARDYVHTLNWGILCWCPSETSLDALRQMR